MEATRMKTSFMWMWIFWLCTLGCAALVVCLNSYGNRPDLIPFLKVVAIVTAILGELCGVFGVLRSK